jgi:glycogen debranching enzyme
VPEEEIRQDQERESNKLNIVTDAHASTTRSIANAVIIKDQEIFFLSMLDGQVPMDPGHGYGLYYNDCRYLKGYEVKLGNTAPDSLIAMKNSLFHADFLLTNQEIPKEDEENIQKQSIGVYWCRLIDSDLGGLHDEIRIHNYGMQRFKTSVKIYIRAEFESIFSVRGHIKKNYGKTHPVQWRDNDTLYYRYDGADGYVRVLLIHFSQKGKHHPDQQMVEFDLSLNPREEFVLNVQVLVQESHNVATSLPKPCRTIDRDEVLQRLCQDFQEWKKALATFETDYDLLNKVINRSVEDLKQLTHTLNGYKFYGAGMPWFFGLFGRDSAWAAYQTLVYDTKIAESTLRVLARYQGKKIDEESDEQPGKIMHEYHTDEITRMGKLPYAPSYGSVDSTMLFLILLGQQAYWSGSLDLFTELEENAERALDWIEKYGDTNGDGFVDYVQVGQEPYNQAWKDSGNAIVDIQGKEVSLPLALIEVQAYVYAAKRLMADLYRRKGNKERARKLFQEARHLKREVNRKFWMEDRGFFLLALHGKGLPVDVVSSNPGHALWAGVIERYKAAQVVKRLMADDMFAGWGIRTLSSKEKAYNPVGYHLGTIWPFDNSVIAAGFKRYGYAAEAAQIFDGIINAAQHFKDFQLPETFSGFNNQDFNQPAHYPVAAHPQAWSAGSIPFFLTTLLGLRPNAFEKKLSIVHPVLPIGVNTLTIRGLKMGTGVIDLKFTRNGEGVIVDVLKRTGDIRVVVQP